jgi:hypothetical protein
VSWGLLAQRKTVIKMMISIAAVANRRGRPWARIADRQLRGVLLETLRDRRSVFGNRNAPDSAVTACNCNFWNADGPQTRVDAHSEHRVVTPGGRGFEQVRACRPCPRRSTSAGGSSTSPCAPGRAALGAGMTAYGFAKVVWASMAAAVSTPVEWTRASFIPTLRIFVTLLDPGPFFHGTKADLRAGARTEAGIP